MWAYGGELGLPQEKEDIIDREILHSSGLTTNTHLDLQQYVLYVQGALRSKYTKTKDWGMRPPSPLVLHVKSEMNSCASY